MTLLCKVQFQFQFCPNISECHRMMVLEMSPIVFIKTQFASYY